ncbi:4-(cytidine 5'-diphospho)-2-C-methyl-D-erythritol kinase [Jannaschia aquimarina]|uniref:4-diphosphocytidyl-2-C-methyl-D-erythritol kinase n=1 Tax=Jannaschia aquimarina TaxID=935700 RepID=A0A0D1CPF4_9RHOB|nr:4-(cytidine 5'-diphospho)-2-C-methyl-D-erythritol kinase [Jannaschia aquimarina]KIT16642.1 4-diphosphocytidyl-2-C-methyl-D-erythritol kinase [Jannaschia aquimarina]SNS93551.1 4-diphosphocytidyl-2-C-methyl-D-erythritol kinase [Jannaschia aquimarina]
MTAHVAPAKVNLSLHVTGRRADGRHDLDSLVAFADVGDRLTVAPGDRLSVSGPFAAGVPTDDSNLIRRALREAGERRNVALDKRLPHPAGIGGGSSDAAAVLRAVGTDLSVETLMALGADLPVCLLARGARMRGAGERVEPVDLPPLPAVLVNPGVPVPTGAVFAGLARRDNAPMPDRLPDWPDAAALTDWLTGMRNDLEPPARALAPPIDEALAALRDSGADLARMSGSGATCFGLYADKTGAERAAAALGRPDWWVQATVLS